MTPYRQPIWPGDQGSDVLAVKRAMRAMGVPGSGGLIVSGPGRKRAGSTFVSLLDRVLAANGKAADGKYGPQAHAIIAPHFDAWGVVLYRMARIRTRVVPPADLSAAAAATRLVALSASGKFRDDRGSCLPQIKAAAAGRPVWSPAGRYVFLDRRWMDAILTLIEDDGMTIGVFAICSDHGYDSPSGHAGGFCVDISSVDGVSVAAPDAFATTLKAATALHDLTGALHPWQLISGGYGNHRDPTLSALSIPAADSFYGSATMAQHTNHIHAGYAPTGA